MAHLGVVVGGWVVSSVVGGFVVVRGAVESLSFGHESSPFVVPVGVDLPRLVGLGHPVSLALLQDVSLVVCMNCRCGEEKCC